MKDNVKWDEQRRARINEMPSVRAFVRFIARRAAERRWKAVERKKEIVPQQQQGDSP